jgi:hypothetical protein
MRNNRFSDIMYFDGGGFIAAHLRKDASKNECYLQITIVRSDISSDPIMYDQVVPKLSDASGQQIEIQAAHPPSFICIDRSQECGLYKISESAYEKSNSLEIFFNDVRYDFEFGTSRSG